jgi:hypothetical protein
VVEVAGERNSTLVMPVPVELLRFFEKMAPGPAHPEHEPAGPDDLGDAEVASAEAALEGRPSAAGPPDALPPAQAIAIPPVPAIDIPPVQAPEIKVPQINADGEQAGRP